MTRITARRLFLASLATLHFLAAPCVMAMTVTGSDEPCGHCDAGADPAVCVTTAASPGADAAAPGPGRQHEPDPARALSLLVPFPTAEAGLPNRVGPSGHRRGRHGGDPPVRLLYGRFLI